MLDDHFAHIARRHRCVLPGEPLTPGAINVCLTFDDGYFDFYAVVFPLLQKHGLRALLAVPPSVVRERAKATAAKRLAAAADVSSVLPYDGGFCTWSELLEMATSGFVTIAAHGFTHCQLNREGVDLHAEVIVPQTLLSARLGQPVNSFVFPYGRFSPGALQAVRKKYRHAFRIGGADNAGWNGRVLYRVDADAMKTPDGFFSWPRLALYRARRFWNRARRR